MNNLEHKTDGASFENDVRFIFSNNEWQFFIIIFQSICCQQLESI